MFTVPGRTSRDDDKYSHACQNSSSGESCSIARKRELRHVIPAWPVNLLPANADFRTGTSALG